MYSVVTQLQAIVLASQPSLLLGCDRCYSSDGPFSDGVAGRGLRGTQSGGGGHIISWLPLVVGG